MIGPTGVGKTEIARRLARLADAPFIKVEATKFTEVGYVGRDVDTIVRDLVEIGGQADARAGDARKVRDRAEDAAEERVLDVLLPPARDVDFQRRDSRRQRDAPEIPQEAARGRARRQGDRDRGGRGAAADGDPGAARHGGADRADPGHVLQTSAAAAARLRKHEDRARRCKLLTDEEAAQAGQRRRAQDAARSPTPSRTASCSSTRSTRSPAAPKTHGADVSRQGVQRDLLPLVEGTTVIDQVRHGQDRPHPVHRVGRVPSGQAVAT